MSLAAHGDRHFAGDAGQRFGRQGHHQSGDKSILCIALQDTQSHATHLRQVTGEPASPSPFLASANNTGAGGDNGIAKM
jgi:hypothetical protein